MTSKIRIWDSGDKEQLVAQKPGRELEASLGVTFRDPALLRLALTHRSFLYERPLEAPESNERLEFLGDALLGFVIGDALFKRYPEEAEGSLTEARSRLVRTETLASIAAALGIGDHLLLGRGEEASGGRGRARNLARAFEAVIGAIYVDQGYRKARSVLLRIYRKHLAALHGGLVNYKSLLQEEVQATRRRPPMYTTIGEAGPGHTRLFTVEVRTETGLIAHGEGNTKQQAQQAAAKSAYESMTTGDQGEAGRGLESD